ncbi:MAG: PKD domain-containing protein [Chitinophagales bacterium]
MKKVYLIVTLAWAFVIAANAQITLNTADMPTTGWTMRFAKDTLPLPAINFGSPGANQVYDFSNLQVLFYDTTEYRTPTSTQTTNYPGCNLAITNDGSNFLLAKNAASVFDYRGLEGYIGTTQSSAPFSPVEDIYHFPTQYNGNFSGSWGFISYLPGSALGLPVNDIKVTFTATFTDTIDGYGRVKTPVGSYKGLRQKRKEYSHTVIGYRFVPVGSYTTYSDEYDTTVRYNYLAKESKGALLTFDYDSLNNVKGVTWSMIPPNKPIANFSSNNPSGGLVVFTDLSDNYPDTWHWSFGDGGTSTSQNPNHTYAANGTYTVCLRVTNAGGTDSICKTVTISSLVAGNHAPVAFDDTLTIVAGQSQILHVAGNDLDPDGDNLCMDTVWGSPYATEYIGGSCDMIWYAPDSTFYGSDTAYYRVCDNGTPVLCDTGMVVFTVQQLNHAPIANNDVITTLQPAPGFVNVGTNDSDPESNNFCVTSVYGSPYFTIAATGNCTTLAFTPDSTFTGNDTAWYVICDNGTPSLCDTAIVVATVTPNAALLPVADFNGTPAGVFSCQAGIGASDLVTVVSTASGIQNWLWTVTTLQSYDACPDSTELFSTDSISFSASTLFHPSICSSYKLEVCLTVTNAYGQSTKCDTICNIIWEGINELPLAGVQIFPNPSVNYVTIDMHNNTEAITQNYSAVYIQNALGQRVRQVSNSGKVITLQVGDLPQGMYIATIADSKGALRTLGRFTINR